MDEEEGIPSKVPRADPRPDAFSILKTAPGVYQGETSSCVGEIMKQCNGGYSSDNPLKVTILAIQWGSSFYGSSFLSSVLAIQLARFSQVQVTMLVPEHPCYEWENRLPATADVTIVKAKERPGFDDPVDWLIFPPQGLVTDIVVGVGERLGKIAQIFKELHKCKNIYITTNPWEEREHRIKQLEIHINELEWKFQDLETFVNVGLSETAEFSVAIGPKMGDKLSSSLRFQSEKKVLKITPGILKQFSDVKHATADGTKFRILVFGGRNPDNFEQEGLDTAAKAVAELNDKSYHLVYVGAAKGKHEQFIKKFRQCGVAKTQLSFRSLPKHEEDLKRLFCEVDLAIMPSGEQGFGMVALAALSAGLPILVHGDSGFGEVLREVKFGTSSTVDSDDAKVWAKAIKKVRETDRKTRLEEAAILRSSYDEKYSWEEQCGELVTIMLSVASAQPNQTK